MRSAYPILFFCQWGEGQLNFSSPLEAILDKIKLNPVMTMYGPMDTESLIWLLTAPFSIRSMELSIMLISDAVRVRR